MKQTYNLGDRVQAISSGKIGEVTYVFLSLSGFYRVTFMDDTFGILYHDEIRPLTPVVVMTTRKKVMTD